MLEVIVHFAASILLFVTFVSIKDKYELSSSYLIPEIEANFSTGVITTHIYLELVDSNANHTTTSAYLNEAQNPSISTYIRPLTREENILLFTKEDTLNKQSEIPNSLEGIEKLLSLSSFKRGLIRMYFVHNVHFFPINKTAIISNDRAIAVMPVDPESCGKVVHQIIKDIFFKQEEIITTKMNLTINMNYKLMFLIVVKNTTLSGAVKRLIMEFLLPFNNSLNYTSMTYNFTNISTPIAGNFTPEQIWNHHKPYLVENILMSWIMIVNSPNHTDVRLLDKKGENVVRSITFVKNVAVNVIDEQELYRGVDNDIMWLYLTKLKELMGFKTTLPSYIQYIGKTSSALNLWELDSWLFDKERECLKVYMIERLRPMKFYFGELNCLEKYSMVLKAKVASEKGGQNSQKTDKCLKGACEVPVAFRRAYECLAEEEWMMSKKDEKVSSLDLRAPLLTWITVIACCCTIILGILVLCREIMGENLRRRRSRPRSQPPMRSFKTIGSFDMSTSFSCDTDDQINTSLNSNSTGLSLAPSEIMSELRIPRVSPSNSMILPQETTPPYMTRFQLRRMNSEESRLSTYTILSTDTLSSVRDSATEYNIRYMTRLQTRLHPPSSSSSQSNIFPPSTSSSRFNIFPPSTSSSRFNIFPPSTSSSRFNIFPPSTSSSRFNIFPPSTSGSRLNTFNPHLNRQYSLDYLDVTRTRHDVRRTRSYPVLSGRYNL